MFPYVLLDPLLRENPFRCDICQVFSSGEVDFKNHCAGKKHQAKLVTYLKFLYI